MSKLRIILFDGNLSPSTFIYRLAKGLSYHHDIYILGFQGKPRTEYSKIKYISCGSSANNISLITISLKLAIMSVLKKGKFKFAVKTIWLLLIADKKELQRNNFNIALALLQPDILHVQWPSLLEWCHFAVEDPAIKVILSQRGYQTNIRPFINAENKAYLQRWYPKMNGFHSVSQDIQAMGDLIDPRPDKVQKVVYSGYKVALFPFRTTYERHQPLRILSVGRPHWIKGYPESLKATALLKKQGIAFEYSIIGAHDEEELLYLRWELGLETEVRLLPRMTQEEVYNEMCKTDVLWFPSYKEGMPNVVVEAMLLGLPVIATACGGVSELLDASTGWLVPLNDPDALARALQEFLVTSEAEIDNRRKRARERSVDQHNEERMIQEMTHLYQAVLRGS